MSNMSYCRFENTYGDLKDCVEALEEAMDEGVSLKEFTSEMTGEELNAFYRMATLCSRMIEAYSDMTTMQLEDEEGDQYA